MGRYIEVGDKVRIFVNKDSWMPPIGDGRVIWTVTYVPNDTGDSWYFERDGQRISINSNSANFDGLELVEEALHD